MKKNDNELVRDNRLFLDNYYKSNNLLKNSIPMKKKIINVFRGYGFLGLIYFILKKLFSKKNNYISDTKEENVRGNSKKKYKVAVYTSIIGKYDTLLEPKYVSDNCDYFIFTDGDIPSESVWKKKKLPSNQQFLTFNSYQKAKYFKIFPHELFPEYDYSIWVDGNIEIIGDLIPFIDRMGNDFYWAEFLHPNNDCVYDESFSIVSQGKYNALDVKKQMKIYKSNGFPKHFGLFENSFIIRKHNDFRCKKICFDWWEQLNKYTWRDQLSLSYVLWENSINFKDIYCLGPCWRWNPRLRQYFHNEKKDV